MVSLKLFGCGAGDGATWLGFLCSKQATHLYSLAADKFKDLQGLPGLDDRDSDAVVEQHVEHLGDVQLEASVAARCRMRQLHRLHPRAVQVQAQVEQSPRPRLLRSQAGSPQGRSFVDHSQVLPLRAGNAGGRERIEDVGLPDQNCLLDLLGCPQPGALLDRAPQTISVKAHSSISALVEVGIVARQRSQGLCVREEC